MSIPSILNLMLTWVDRTSIDPNVLNDACDGEILRDQNDHLFADLGAGVSRNSCFPFAICCDGTDIKSKNIIPITLSCLALPPYLRDTFTGIYLGGILPMGSKCQSIFIEPLLQQFRDVAPGTGGMLIDGHRVWAVLAYRVDGLKEIYQAINGNTNPATNSTCIQCTQQAFRTCKKQYIYPGAICTQPANSPLRTAHGQEYSKSTALHALSKPDQRRPQKMNEQAAYDSATRAASGDLTAEQLKLEPYRGYNIFTTLLGMYFDIVKMSINDPFHMIINTIKDIFRLIARKSKSYGKGMAWTEKRKKYERNKLGRFKDKQIPFQAKSEQSGRLTDSCLLGISDCPVAGRVSARRCLRTSVG